MSNLTPDQNFELTGLTLPPAPEPIGVYVSYLVVGDFLYVSGHGPILNDKTLIKGKVGKDMDMDEAKIAAQHVGLNILSTIKNHLGSLNKVKRVVKTLGMVNCIPEFERHPHVINGCSELFAKVWGTERGIGVRSAVGFNSLPNNKPVEIEVLFELEK